MCSFLPDVTISAIIITDRERRSGRERARNTRGRVRQSQTEGGQLGRERTEQRMNRVWQRDRKETTSVECARNEEGAWINGVANDGRADKRDN